MIVYWTIYAIPALIALSESNVYSRRVLHPILIFMVALFFLMAFRETGGDYPTYREMYELYASFSLAEWLQSTEALYGAINWLCERLDLGLYGVNAICAFIFLTCLYRYSMDEQKRVLLLAIAMPYLVIVTAIGYTRQGTAIGLFMLALTYVRRQKPFHFLACALAGVGFHNSAVLTLPFGYFAIAGKLGRMQRYALIAAGLVILYFLYGMLTEKFNDQWGYYVSSGHYNSAGAFQRSLLSGAAACVFLVFRKRWKAMYGDHRQYLVMALAALAAVPASLVASTAVDRMGLFLQPFQVITFARLPVFFNDGRWRQVATVMVLVGYTLVLYSWLHLGQFASELWLPFSNLLTGTIE